MPTTDRSESDRRAARWAVFALFGLFLSWSVIAPLTMPNITMDAAEGLMWGQTWRLGYPKHPPLQAWLLEIARSLFGTSSFAHVWLSAACVVLSHVAVWRTARRLVDPITAFWASASLQTIVFYTYTTPEFNPSVLQLPFFAFAGLFAVRAAREGRTLDWLALGAVLGVGMYAKYSVALIAIAIATFFLADRNGRRRLAAPGPWLGVLLALAIFAPHLAWMIDNNGRTVSYVVTRAHVASTLAGRLANLGSLIVNFAAISLPLGLALWLGRDRSAAAATEPLAVAPDAHELRRLILTLAVVPIALTAAVAMTAGFKIKTEWLSPLWTFVPLALMSAGKIDARRPAWRRGAIVVAVMAVLGLAGYVGTNVFRPQLAGLPMRIQFPGARLAQRVDEIWAARSASPLAILIGDTMEAGSVANYSRYRPKVRVTHEESGPGGDPLDRDIPTKGAVILWSLAKDQSGLPADLKALWPTAEVVDVATLPFQTPARVSPARIGVAIVPPAKDRAFP